MCTQSHFAGQKQLPHEVKTPFQGSDLIFGRWSRKSMQREKNRIFTRVVKRVFLKYLTLKSQVKTLRLRLPHTHTHTQYEA